MRCASFIPVLALLSGCFEPPPAGKPQPRISAAAGADAGEATVPAVVVPTDDPAKPDPARPRIIHSLYASRDEVAKAAARVASDPAFRKQVAEMIKPAQAWERVPAPPKGVYTTYASPFSDGPFDPWQGSPAWKQIAGDARAARDLALAWALNLEPPRGRLDAAAPTRDDLGRRAVAIIRRYAGTGGLAPVISGRQAALELSIAVAALYHAADLVWDHPAWQGDGADGSPKLDFRATTFCQWAHQWGRSVQMQLGSLSGIELAWAHHLRAASISIASRSDLVYDNHAQRLTRALDGEDYFSLPGVLSRELSAVGHVPREQSRRDGPARAVFALAGYTLSMQLSRTQAAWALPKDGKWSAAGLTNAAAGIAAAYRYQAPLLAPPPPREPPPSEDGEPPPPKPPPPPRPAILVWYRVAGTIWPETAGVAKTTPEPALWLLGPMVR